MTNEAFRFVATDQAAEIGLTDTRVVVEPSQRDTAPAVLAAALLLEAAGHGEEMMLVVPSDHVIGDVAAFHAVVEAGLAAAEDGFLVTFGIAPDRPVTAYGYLELSAEPQGQTPVPLKSFREKPDAATVAEMIAAGNFLWNAGIFLFRVRDIIASYTSHAPDLVPACRTAVKEGAEDLTFFRLGAAGYDQARSVSIDYAIMERAKRVATVPFQGGWADISAWDGLWAVETQDSNGVVANGMVTAIDCHNSYLRSEENNIHLAALGLDGVVAVAMRDAVLVAAKDRVQDVKKVVKTLRAGAVDQADHYPRFHRPWGWYETLCIDTRFQVKRIMVKPGGILSLQSHHHRSEHWVVVTGTAEVTIGDEVKLVTENQSVYIPLGTVHRMANPGKLPMYLIEVQTGAYLGEDDIERYEDIYNRS